MISLFIESFTFLSNNALSVEHEGELNPVMNDSSNLYKIEIFMGLVRIYITAHVLQAF